MGRYYSIGILAVALFLVSGGAKFVNESTDKPGAITAIASADSQQGQIPVGELVREAEAADLEADMKAFREKLADEPIRPNVVRDFDSAYSVYDEELKTAIDRCRYHDDPASCESAKKRTIKEWASVRRITAKFNRNEFDEREGFIRDIPIQFEDLQARWR